MSFSYFVFGWWCCGGALLVSVQANKPVISEDALEERAQRVQAGSAWRAGDAQDENLPRLAGHCDLPTRMPHAVNCARTSSRLKATASSAPARRSRSCT